MREKEIQLSFLEMKKEYLDKPIPSFDVWKFVLREQETSFLTI